MTVIPVLLARSAETDLKGGSGKDSRKTVHAIYGGISMTKMSLVKWSGLSGGTLFAALAIPGCDQVTALIQPLLGIVGLA